MNKFDEVWWVLGGFNGFWFFGRGKPNFCGDGGLFGLFWNCAVWV